MEALHLLKAFVQYIIIRTMLSISIKLYIHFNISTQLHKIWYARRVEKMQRMLDAEHKYLTYQHVIINSILTLSWSRLCIFTVYKLKQQTS